MPLVQVQGYGLKLFIGMISGNVYFREIIFRARGVLVEQHPVVDFAITIGPFGETFGRVPGCVWSVDQLQSTNVPNPPTKILEKHMRGYDETCAYKWTNAPSTCYVDN